MSKNQFGRDLNKGSPLNGMIINFIGDSITYGTYMTLDTHEYIRSDKRYCEIACGILHAKYRNYGIDSTCISGTSIQLPSLAMVKRYRDMNTDADMVVVAGGTNDFGTSVTLGDKLDITDVSFSGALNKLCTGLKEMYPKKAVVFITPLPRYDEHANSIGLSLDEYRQAITEIAGGIHGFIVLDGRAMGLDAKDAVVGSELMPDGAHPTPQAHEIIGKHLAEALSAIYAR